MNPLSFLAEKAVEKYVKENQVILPPDGLPEEFLKRRAGVFVTIEENGRLCGCVGTYLPTRDNIAEETIYNAVAAATEDYRFNPVEEDDLPNLSYTVSILSEPEIVKDMKELDPKKYGIIIKTANSPIKSALLLPDLEGVDSVEKQIAITCQKGGINPEKEKIAIYRFKIEKHEK